MASIAIPVGLLLSAWRGKPRESYRSAVTTPEDEYLIEHKADEIDIGTVDGNPLWSCSPQEGTRKTPIREEVHVGSRVGQTSGT